MTHAKLKDRPTENPRQRTRQKVNDLHMWEMRHVDSKVCVRVLGILEEEPEDNCREESGEGDAKSARHDFDN